MVALMVWESDTSYVTAVTHGIKSLRIPRGAEGISGSCKPSVIEKEY